MVKAKKPKDKIEPEPEAIVSPLFHVPTAADVVGDLAISEKFAKEAICFRINFDEWCKARRRTLDTQSQQKVAEAAGSTVDGVTAAARVLPVKHPVVKEAMELQRRLMATIPACGGVRMAHLSVPGCVEPATYMLPIQRAGELKAKLDSYATEITAMENRLNQHRDSILAMEQARLKDQFRIDDYPDQFTLKYSFAFFEPRVPAALEKLNPELYEQMRRQRADQLDRTLEQAVHDVLGEFEAVLSRWQEALSPVYRIYPPPGQAAAFYHGAEIRRTMYVGTYTLTLPKGDGPEETVTVTVPPDKRALLIRHYPNKSTKLHETVLGPMNVAEYAALCPTHAPEDRRMFKASTIEGLQQFLSNFAQIRQTIGLNDTTIDKMVGEINTHLAQLPTPEKVADELRNSATFRAQTHALMDKLAAQVQNEVATVRGRPRITFLAQD